MERLPSPDGSQHLDHIALWRWWLFRFLQVLLVLFLQALLVLGVLADTLDFRALFLLLVASLTSFGGS